MKIYCGFDTTEESRAISKKLHDFGIGWKNIKNEFLDLVAIRVVFVPKTKRERLLGRFPQIKEGCPRNWLQGLDITHYWDWEERS